MIENEKFKKWQDVFGAVQDCYMVNWTTFVEDLLKTNAKNLPVIGQFVSFCGLGFEVSELVVRKIFGGAHDYGHNRKFGEIAKDSLKLATLSAIKTAGFTLKVVKSLAEVIGMFFGFNK